MPLMGFVQISSCESQLEGAIGEDGSGYVYEALEAWHFGPASCTLTQCDEGEDAEHHEHALIPWPFVLESTSTMEITFCLRGIDAEEGAETPKLECHTNFDFVEDGTHQQELRATGAPGSGLCENLETPVRVIGHWNFIPSAGHPVIEVVPNSGGR